MFGKQNSEPAEAVKRHPVLAMPRPRALEEEFAEFVPAQPDIRRAPAVGNSESMQQVQKILNDGLTHAFKDGDSALQAAIEESKTQVTSLEARVETHREQFDAMKRECAEYLMAHSKKGEELKHDLDTSIARLHALTKYLEDDRAAIENPPRALAPPLAERVSPAANDEPESEA